VPHLVLIQIGRVIHKQFATWIAEHLRVESAVVDGEIACVDDDGRPVFRDLLFRRRQFIAFDLLFLNVKDLRVLPLIERKAALKKLLPRKRSRILYLQRGLTELWEYGRMIEILLDAFFATRTDLSGASFTRVSSSIARVSTNSISAFETRPCRRKHLIKSLS
jgi:hypothetical protein